MVDRYYRVFDDYLRTGGVEPNDKELSAYCALRGMTGRGGRPVSPSAVCRYLPEFRIYAVWNDHLDRQGVAPDEYLLAQLLADRGIVAQYGAVYTPGKLEAFVARLPAPPYCARGRPDAERRIVSNAHLSGVVRSRTTDSKVT